MNTPYVKVYENGILSNPIKGSYLHKESETRKDRREHLKKTRFHGESKNHHLTIFKNMKYHRVRQVINLKDKKTGKLTGEKRIIEHTLTN